MLDLFLPRAKVIPSSLGDVSSNFRVFQRPWTYGFMPPDLPGIAGHMFRGSDFFLQFREGKTMDMTTTGGGDTFELCGHASYHKFNLEIDPKKGSGQRRWRVVKKYVPRMIPRPEGEEGPEIFSGGYIIEDEELVDTNTLSALVVQERVVNGTTEIIYEWQADEKPGAPPNFARIGSFTYQQEVKIGDLASAAKDWQEDMASASAAIFDGGQQLDSYWRSTSTSGECASLGAGLALVRGSAVAPFPWETGEYSVAGIKVHYEMEERANMPVAYEDDGQRIVGNRMYGRGKAVRTLTGRINSKIWKDDFGIFDQTQGALNDFPWLAQPGYPGFHRDGMGVISRGCFISLGGHFRVTLAKYEGDGPGGAVQVVDVPPGERAEYWFPLVSSDAEAFAVVLSRIDRLDGGNWLPIDVGDYAKVLQNNPGNGAELLHVWKIRVGLRWGYREFEPQDPVPTLERDWRCYRTMIHTKSAQP